MSNKPKMTRVSGPPAKHNDYSEVWAQLRGNPGQWFKMEHSPSLRAQLSQRPGFDVVKRGNFMWVRMEEVEELPPPKGELQATSEIDTPLA